MAELRYLENVVTLRFNKDRCIGCGMCVEVCPHAVFALNKTKAEEIDHNACMECGACAVNCPTEAITVESGVGCAAAVIKGALSGQAPSCGCDEGRGAGDSCCDSKKSSCC